MMIPQAGADGWRFLRVRRKAPAPACVPAVIVTGIGIGGQEWTESPGATTLPRKPLDAWPSPAVVRHRLSTHQKGVRG